VSEVITQYRKMHSEELQDLYFSPDSVSVIKSLRTRCVRYVASTGAMEKVPVLSVQKLDGKIQCGRPRRRSGYSIKMDLMKTGNEVVNGIKVV